MITTEQIQFSYNNEITPIILQNGIASNYPDGVLPIATLFQQYYQDNQNYFALFKPLPNSTLEEWQVAEYPFASLVVAANAVIQQPLKVSMLMIAPAQNNGGYPLKTSVITAIKAQLDTHILQGGSFVVVTPAYTYNNCLLTSIRDVTEPSNKQVQSLYQWDFVQPLITQQAAQQVLGNLMNKIQNGQPTPTNIGGTAGWNSTPPNYPNFYNTNVS